MNLYYVWGLDEQSEIFYDHMDFESMYTDKFCDGQCIFSSGNEFIVDTSQLAIL